MRNKCRYVIRIAGIVIWPLFFMSCPAVNSAIEPGPGYVPLSAVAQTDGADFEGHIKRQSAENGVYSLIIERPAFDGTTPMRIAVLYPSVPKSEGSSCMSPVVIAPGFSAGAFVYSEYACSLAQAGHIVFLPDIEGDYVHFIGLEPMEDPMIEADFRALQVNMEALRTDLEEYEGTDDMDYREVFRLFKGIHNGGIQDQNLCDIFRNHLFAYRSYSLDVVVRSIFEINEDVYSPLCGVIATDRIGLEGHSLGCDEIVDAIVLQEGVGKYWWVNNINVVLLKAAQTCLQGPEHFQSVATPVFFMTGEYDNRKYIIEPNWSNFNGLQSNAGYFTLYNAGHMVFVDPPIGFLGEKLIPALGDFENIDWESYQRNRATVLNLSALLYEAFLDESPEAIEAVTHETYSLAGEAVTRKIQF
ncbi:MAG: hypothetical protein IT364_13380 [Candidatus Hydrogenedentes bacterium]|nr:hypothetical protein [Candidatus Hydrogenedentota bacterium]